MPWNACLRPLQAGRALVIAALCGAAAFAAHAATCPMPADTPSLMTTGPVQASWTTEPAVPVVGEPFVMRSPCARRRRSW